MDGARLHDEQFAKTLPYDWETSIILKNLTSAEIVLDVGCGTGRHMVPLAEKGLHVLGIDTNKDYVKSAKEKLESKRLTDKADLVIGDARLLPFKRSFIDAIICMGNVLGDVGIKKQDRVTIVQEMVATAKPDTTLIIEFVHRYWKPTDLFIWLCRYSITCIKKMLRKPAEFGDYAETIRLDHHTTKLTFHAFTAKEATQLFSTPKSHVTIEKRAKLFYDWFILVVSRKTQTNKVP